MRRETRSGVRFVSPAGQDTPVAAEAGGLVFTGGGIAADPVHGIPPEVLPLDGYPNHWSRINRELGWIYAGQAAALCALGTSPERTLRINSFHTDPADVYEALRLRPEVFGEEPPASTLVLVPEVPVTGGRVALDTIALGASATDREALLTSTPDAPMPPHERIWGRRIYSKAVRGGGFIFTAGRTNNVIGGPQDGTARGVAALPYARDRTEATTRMILDYLSASLRAFGAGLGDVVKAEIHLSDMTQIAGIERVWRAAFPENPPARVFVPCAFPTTYSTIEIEFIALDPRGGFDRETVGGLGVAPAHGHEPVAVRAGPYVFFSGLSAHDGIHGLAPGARADPAYPFHDSQARREAGWLIERLDEILSGRAIVPLRRRAMMPDLGWLAQADAAWRDRFGALPPTTDFRTALPLPVPSTGLQIDFVAWCG